MKIRRIHWTTFRLPFAGAFATAYGSQSVREGAFLRLITSTGLEGIGEASPMPVWGGGTLDDTLRVIAELGPRLVDLDLIDAEALLAGLDFSRPGVAAAACALDTALLDAQARDAGLPIAVLLGGDAHALVPVNAMVGAPDLTAACQSAQRATEAGFGCVKLKVGIADGIQAEIARIAAVREAIGTGVRLRVDANGAWSVAQAITIIDAVQRYDLELVEQPVAAEDLDGMAHVRRSVATPIGADEPVGGPEQAERVIDAGAADILVVKPMLAGGLRRGQEVIALARAAGLGVIVTTTIDAGVGVAAALHLAATLPTAHACGLATGPLLVSDLLKQPLSVQDGTMPLPGTSGLGVTLDEQEIGQYGDGWDAVL